MLILQINIGYSRTSQKFVKIVLKVLKYSIADATDITSIICEENKKKLF